MSFARSRSRPRNHRPLAARRRDAHRARPRGSHGCWIANAITGEDYLDAFTCFASWPIGYNHRAARPGFQGDLLNAPSEAVELGPVHAGDGGVRARSTSTWPPPEFPHHFWVSGGSLAVEGSRNRVRLEGARKLGRTNYEGDCNDLVIFGTRSTGARVR
ncbi:MAG: hypothetical protein R3B49_00610 [Phycisphaerales bacterium]